MLVPSCITVGSGSVPTEPCAPEDEDEENSCSTPPFKEQHWNDDYSAERQLQYENAASVVISASDNSERERKVASEGNMHPINNSTNNYAYTTRINSHARTRRASGIKPPSAPVTFEALEEQRFKCEMSPCRGRSVFRGVCCSNARKKQPSITDSTSDSDLLYTCDCYSHSIRTHGDDQATSAESSPPLHIPTPPSPPGCNRRTSSPSSSNVIQPKGVSSRLRVTVRVVNSATNGRNDDGFNSVENKNVIRQGSGKGEIIVTNPSKVSQVAAALSEANLASFDWAKVFNFDATIVLDADAPGAEQQPGKEMEDVFESAVSPALQTVFHEGISGAIFALQPQPLPCTQGTAENNCVC